MTAGMGRLTRGRFIEAAWVKKNLILVAHDMGRIVPHRGPGFNRVLGIVRRGTHQQRYERALFVGYYDVATGNGNAGNGNRRRRTDAIELHAA